MKEIIIKGTRFSSEKRYFFYKNKDDISPWITTPSKRVWKTYKWETRTGKTYLGKLTFIDRIRIILDI